MRYLFWGLLVVLCASVWTVVLTNVATTKPKVSPAYIPYCWAKDHGLYLPCMYSSKEYNA